MDISQAYDSQQFRQQGHQLVDLLADYLQATHQKGTAEKVLNYASPEALYADWKNDLHHEPMPGDVAHFFKTILQETIHIHHPNYMGHQTSCVAPLAALAELFGSLIDPGMGVFEQGNSGVVFERIINDELAKTFGWGGGSEGFLTSGGTLGNLTALLCARQVMIPEDVWEHGFQGRQYGFLVSSEAHYSVAKAIKTMGMGSRGVGSRGVVQVPVNERFQMRADLLGECFDKAEKEGVTIIGVVANACSTATGSYDPIAAIADFCEDKNLWLHVDGAHGACVAFSKKYRHLLSGIERADSVIMDFHKMLMTPKLVTSVAFRRGEHSYQTFAQKASYLWDTDEGREWFNLAKRTFELTKSYMSIRVFALWRTYGAALFEANVDQLHDLAQACAQLLSEQPDFETAVAKPESNILCFRYLQKDWDEEKIEKTNAAIRQKLVEDGEFFIVQTRVKGKLYLRTTLMNPLTGIGEFKALLLKIRELASTESIRPA